MKKAIVILCLVAFMASCGNNSSSGENTGSNSNASDASAKKEQAAEDPMVQKGLDLVAKSDCFTCHKIEEPYTGPAYVKVAERYPKNDQVLDSLSQKIIRGGSGNWGTVPMIAHPQVSPEDAKAMVAYVLSLKK